MVNVQASISCGIYGQFMMASGFNENYHHASKEAFWYRFLQLVNEKKKHYKISPILFDKKHIVNFCPTNLSKNSRIASSVLQCRQKLKNPKAQSSIFPNVLTLSPPSTTKVPYMQTAWIRLRCWVTQRLT